MTAYYNEFDPFAAAWLRELIKAGLIAPGEVDERSIVEVQPDDLRGFTQCHFFAGIGGWSYALRLAGWPDHRPVWTGSCPCQPFSAAGKQAGTKDDRHLWPEFFRLIRESRPDTVFGEQVAAAIGLDWLDHVSADLEAEGYAVGSIVLGAHSVGAPHIRQRLWFVAEPLRTASKRGAGGVLGTQAPVSGARLEDGNQPDGFAAGSEAGEFGELGDADDKGSQGLRLRRDGADQRPAGTAGVAGFWHPAAERTEARTHRKAQKLRETLPIPAGTQPEGRSGDDAGSGSVVGGFWHPADWLPCRDGKARPVEPGTFPLAHGLPARVGRLRGYGNAIVPQVAAEVIGAYLDARLFL